MSISIPIVLNGLHAIAPILAAGATTAPASQASAVTQPGETPNLLVPLVATAVAVGIAAWVGVFRPSKVDGPPRVERARPLWPIALVFAAGVVAWFGTQVAYASYKQVQLAKQSGPDARVDLSMFTAADFAWLATVPALLGFIVLLGGNVAADVAAQRKPFATLAGLGGRMSHLPKGLGKGLIATLIVLPCMLLVLTLTDIFYRRVGFQHPAEHDLLRKMTEAPSAFVKWAIIAGAVIGAPLFEEFLFRGHLQTLLREALVRWSGPREPSPVPSAFEPVMAGSAGAAAAWGLPTAVPQAAYDPHAAPAYALPPAGVPAGFGPMTPPPPPPVFGVPLAEDATYRRPRIWQGWIAILVTSIGFGLVHPVWMFPPIFILSVALGYTYERTGNLWSNVAMHALFNASSTVLYLLQTTGSTGAP